MTIDHQDDHHSKKIVREMIIWLLSEYQILLSWVEGEKVKIETLYNMRREQMILEDYLVFQSQNVESKPTLIFSQGPKKGYGVVGKGKI